MFLSFSSPNTSSITFSALVFGNLQDPASGVRELLKSRHTVRRKAELGTQPEVFYII